MGKNQQQQAAEARAKKSTPAVQPQPAAAALPAPASKQATTFEKLKEAWAAKGVDLSKMTATPDGKYLDVIVAEGWPLITIGASGGIALPEVRSYPSAFEAAVNGLAVFTKQKERDQKKVAASAPAAPQAPPVPAPAAPAKETVTAKKQKQHAAVEQQLGA